MITAILWYALALTSPLAPEDLACERAVEEWVARATHARPPEPYDSAMRRMGASHWKDREAATNAMVGLGPDARRWLWWGRRESDPEIALRSNVALRRLLTCPECGGTGRHANWRPEWGDRDNWQNPPPPPPVDEEVHQHPNWVWGSERGCCLCGSLGSLWPWTAWDDRVKWERVDE